MLTYLIFDNIALCIGMFHLWHHVSLCWHASYLTTLLPMLTRFIFDNNALYIGMLHLWQHVSLCWHASSWATCLPVLTCYIFDNFAHCVDMLHFWHFCLCWHASSLTVLLTVLTCFIFDNIALCVDMLHLWQHCSLYWHASSLTTLLPVLAYFIFDNITLYIGMHHLWQHFSFFWHTGHSRYVDFTYLDTTTYVEVIFHSQHFFSIFLCISTPSMSKPVNMKQRLSRGDFSCLRRIFYYICYCLCRRKNRHSHGCHIVCFGYVHVLAEVRTSSKQQ